ncbi:MAG: hypothetical protein KJ574_03280 [Nanoarchaeota archaeon]|nr:hypothetical protein [Nanoarchaeota archaeon]
MKQYKEEMKMSVGDQMMDDLLGIKYYKGKKYNMNDCIQESEYLSRCAKDEAREAEKEEREKEKALEAKIQREVDKRTKNANKQIEELKDELRKLQKK